MAKKQFIRCLIIVAIFLLCIVIGVCVQLHGGVNVYPQEDYTAPYTACYYQKDTRWADAHLGESKYTMEDSGCLVTCVCSALTMQHIGESLTPGELNELLSSNDGYDEAGNLQWTALEKIGLADVSLINAEAVRSQCASSLDMYLQSGVYPIVRVRRYGIGTAHYVLIVGAENGEYLCMEPLLEAPELVPLSDYGNRIYAVRCLSDIDDNN